MSFRALHRRAVDPTLAVAYRYRALRQAGASYARLTHTRFTSVFEELRERCDERLVDGPGIARAADALAAARERFLAGLRVVTERRRRDKCAARHRPEPPFASEVRALVTLGTSRVVDAESSEAGEGWAPPSSAPAPAFELGARVRVVLNEQNRTPRTGSVRQRVWHYKFASWTYYLSVEGRKVSKRYLEADLRRVAAE